MSTPTDQWAGLYESEVAEPASLEEDLTLWLGLKGAGKSHLVQSNPASVTLNFDLIPPAHPVVRIFPVRRTGASVTFDDFRRALDQLIKEPRDVRTVNLDTLSAMRHLGMEYLEKQYKKTGKKDFTDMGQAGWRDLNTLPVRIVHELRAAGFGVAITDHLKPGEIPVGPGSEKMVTDPTRLETAMTRGQWDGLRPLTSVVAMVRKQPRMVKGDDGKIRPNPDAGQREAVFELEELPGLLTGRYGMPARVSLPAHGGWEAVSRAYKDAQTKGQA